MRPISSRVGSISEQDGKSETLTLRGTEQLVEVNLPGCESLASIIRTHDIPIDEENASPPIFSYEETGNFYLYLVAICHQTSPRNQPPLEGFVHGKHLKGWDYLSAKSEAAFSENHTMFRPLRWSEMTGQELSEMFRDPKFGDRLTDPEGRAALIRNLGEVLVRNRWEWAQDIYDLTAGRIATGHPNLLEVLARFTAYRDPIRKKSYFFLGLMRNLGRWQYVDDQSLGPPVDYHEMRGHLRLGSVIVTDPSLRQKILDNVPVSAPEDLALRGAVHDAIICISELTGLRNPTQVHYLFWNVFRSCCSRELPHCEQCPPDCPLPERYVPLALHAKGPRRCPFAEVCGSTCATTHRKIYEHVFDTDYY